MSPNVTIEKIVDMLSSEDLELRILGLSYLNDDKSNHTLCVAWHADLQKYKVKSCYLRLHLNSFDRIYRTLQWDLYYLIGKDILFPYVRCCYEIKNL